MLFYHIYPCRINGFHNKQKDKTEYETGRGPQIAT